MLEMKKSMKNIAMKLWKKHPKKHELNTSKKCLRKKKSRMKKLNPKQNQRNRRGVLVVELVECNDLVRKMTPES